MSISTMRGDGGQTSLAGGVRVSKASARVETYGTIDELNSTMGFARSICEDVGIAAFTKSVQQELFKIGSALATPIESPKPQIVIDPALVEMPKKINPSRKTSILIPGSVSMPAYGG